MKGYRTYAIAVLLGLTVIAHSLGWIDTTITNTILGLLGSGAVWTLRAAI